MTLKILRMFLICFAIAAVLNVANFFVCYYIHVNKEKWDWGEEWDEEFVEPTTTKWDDKLKVLLICGDNASDCQNELSELNTIEASTEAPEKFNGPVEADESLLELNAFEEMFSYIKPGGQFNPTQCIPRQSIAIIVPMQDVNRAWKNFIGTFLFYIHLFLMKQLSEYQIFLIIQVGNPRFPYARGKLLNIGFIEVQKMKKTGWDCLIFHDSYYIPTDTRNLYHCTSRPRKLLSTRPESETFGGAVAIRPSVFKKINGFSNIIFHNDGDYANMYQRLIYWNYTIETTPTFIGKYTTLKFNLPNINLTGLGPPLDKSHATTPIYSTDGLSTMNYKVVNAGLKQLFTFIEVDIHTQE